MSEEIFKQRLKEKNIVIDDMNKVIENKNKIINKATDDTVYLLKRIRVHDDIVQEMGIVLEQQKKYIISLENEKDHWNKSKCQEQQIIAQQICNNDNIVSALENELINIKSRLRKYEKVD